MSLPVFDASCSAFRFFGGTPNLDNPISITIAANATVIVGISSDTFGGAITFTVSDGTNTYSESAFKAYDTSSQNRVSLFTFKYTGGAGTKSITVTGSGNVGAGRAFAFSATSCGAFAGADAPLQATGNSTAPATGSTGTLSTAEALVVALFGGNITTWTGGTFPPSGYTTVYANLSNTNTPIALSYKIVSANTAVSAALGTLSSAADQWGALLLVIPGAVAATGKAPIQQLLGG